MTQDDGLGLRIYSDKVALGLSFREIAKKRHVTPSEALRRYNELKGIERGWLAGMSVRAQNRVLKAGYRDQDSLCRDVLNDIVDLESYPWIGHQVAIEIRRWCFKHRRKGDRRKGERRAKTTT